MAETPCIKGFIETSFIDWKGRLSSVLFTGGCNFRCPYCHNAGLVTGLDKLEDVPVDHIFRTLKKYRDWVEHVVITGGEPTIHRGLADFITRLKKKGLKIKLDTNGSNPEVIRSLVKEGLVDYIAMDIKGPFGQYRRWCGVDVEQARIEASADFLLEGHVDYEFRMTVVPFLHREVDIYEAAERVRTARKLVIQEFKPVATLNPAFSHIRPFAPAKIGRIRERVAAILRASQSKGEQENSEG